MVDSATPEDVFIARMRRLCAPGKRDVLDRLFEEMLDELLGWRWESAWSQEQVDATDRKWRGKWRELRELRTPVDPIVHEGDATPAMMTAEQSAAFDEYMRHRPESGEERERLRSIFLGGWAAAS